MFGKTRTIELGPLSLEDTRQLVVKPMSHLGFGFEDENGLIWRIYNETAGHPAFIQLYCRLLVDVLVNEKAEVIKPNHLDSLHDGHELQDYIMDSFVFSTSSLEKIIVLSVLNQNSFTQEDISGALKKFGINLKYKALYKELQDLRLGGIFKQHRGEFSFQYPVMVKIINEIGNPIYIKRENIEEAMKTAERVNAKS